MRDSILPRKLDLGMTIGIISPSSPVAYYCPRRLQRGIKELENLGFNIKLGKYVSTISELGYTTATPKQRADDLNSMFSDKEVSAIICTIGGNSSNHILDIIDYDNIIQNPKIFLGYSDISVIHGAIWQRTGLTTFLGPAILPTFGEFGGLLDFTKHNLFRVICSDQAPGRLIPSPYYVSEINRWDIDDDHLREKKENVGPIVINKGQAEGFLIPTNISALLCHTGTAFFPSLKGAILAIEAAENCNAAEFHQMLVQLKYMGIFQQIKGLMIGRFDARSKTSLEQITTMINQVVPADLPTAINFDFGHTDPAYTLPWGIIANVNFSDSECDFSINEKCVE